MRLHALTVTAFGPFAGTEEVDFDELNDAGLFLLTGPTGAGKSSLLDAVCFALYGTVPGVRGVKTLKSQHAATDARPEVVLDVTVQGRRFVLRRSPEWTRPKKRGDGLLTEKASASIIETTDGTERFLSSRAAEVGHLVTSLMGMNAAQFQQVALLPQGEFQTFLRASSQERHDVLQHLFRTDRFARIEDWVHERSRRLKVEAGAGEAGVRRLVDTVADRAGAVPPEELAGDSLAQATADDRVLPWVTVLLDDARAAADAALEHRQRTGQALDDARRAHEAARHHADQQRRVDAARRTLADLETSRPAADAAAAEVAAHERAGRCLALFDLRRDAAEAVDTTADALATAEHAAGTGADSDVPALLDETTRRLARLEALAPREAEAVAAREAHDRDTARLRAAEHEQQQTAARSELLPAEIDTAERALGEATTLAGRAEALRLTLGTARRRQTAAVELVEVRTELTSAGDLRRDARDAAQDARDAVQRLAARRLAGMAAELAGSLADGVACQVCGSADHPHPAQRADDHVTDADQQAADDALAVCTTALDAADVAVTRLRDREGALVAVAEDADPETLAKQVTSTTAELADAVAAVERLPRLTRTVADLRAEQETLAARRAAAATAVAALRQSVEGHARTLAAVADEVADALGPLAGVEVAAARSELAGLRDRLDAVRQAVRDHDEAARRLDTATSRAVAAASAQGFAHLDDVETALLDDERHRRITERLGERAESEARARAVLDAADDERADAEAPDLASVAADLAERDAAAADAVRAHVLQDDRVTALTRLLAGLGEAIEAWAPLRDDSLRAESISRLVRGMGHDNLLQMRLSAYVLATRLDQVVDAANERLGHMRDQRYLLRRTGRAQRRSAQAGLGLEVVDQWTGDVRAPTTLSGGETFVVSLALALGLADVVTHEAGGTEVETLFVDEGFGTLDADTLDDVMDRLDGLRAGGRTVGVVSHVSELRSRIPTQVLVEKGRAGSSVRVATLVG